MLLAVTADRMGAPVTLPIEWQSVLEVAYSGHLQALGFITRFVAWHEGIIFPDLFLEEN